MGDRLHKDPSLTTVKIRDLVKRIRKPVNVQPDEMYREIGIYSHGKGIFYKKERSGASLGNKSVFWVEPNCFVVNIVFAWEQAIAKTTSAEQGMIASHRFPMYKPIAGQTDLDYLVYFFNTLRGKHLLGLASPGGAGRNKTLGQAAFLDLSIPIPSFSEQRRIAEILGAWDNAITLTGRLIAARQRRKKALMQQLLTGKVRFGGFVGSVWETVRLKEVSEIQYGKSPRDIRNDEGQFLIYGTGGIVGRTDETICNHPAVIIGRKGTIDQPQLVKEPFWAIDTTFYCTPNDRVSVEWIYYALSLIDLAYYNEASGVPSLSRNTLYSIKIPLPPFSEQRRIAAVLQTCDDEIALLEQKLSALKRQKQGLMQQLLSGKVRV